ncbi:MAG: DNA-3-methyladenine glycosylase family protein [bacterium]
MTRTTSDQHAARKLRRELNRAAKIDPRLRDLLARIGYPPPRTRPPGFQTLLRIIVSQQLSTAAAATIWSRIETLCRRRITHRTILNRDRAQLRECGLSRQKVDYAHGLARMVAHKKIDLDAIGELDSESAIAELIAIRGIGRWSAEIYAMFALGHDDVFPAGDLALQVAVQHYASLRARPDAKRTAQIARRWSPHRSSVSLLMWRYYGAATLDD